MNEAGPHTFTLRMASFPQSSWHYITCRSAVQFLLQGRLCSSSWWLGTKEQFHRWHHLVEDVVLKTQSQHVHSGPLSVLQTCTLPDICTLSTNFGHLFSLLWLCPDIGYLYPLLPSQLLSSSLHLHPQPELQPSFVLPLNYVSSLEFIFLLINFMENYQDKHPKTQTWFLIWLCSYCLASSHLVDSRIAFKILSLVHRPVIKCNSNPFIWNHVSSWICHILSSLM